MDEGVLENGGDVIPDEAGFEGGEEGENDEEAESAAGDEGLPRHRG